MLINASRIGKQGTGLYNFSRSVINCLAQRMEDLSILSAELVDFGSGVKKRHVPTWVTITPKTSFFRPVCWYLYVKTVFKNDGEHILCTTHHAIPGIRHQIITIHDLRLLLFPDNFVQYIYFKILLPRYLKNIDAILTVSEQTKEMIIRHYNFAPEKIFIVPNCVDTSKFIPALSLDNGRERYLLAVGATWPHKNIHEILKNADLWAEKYKLIIIAGAGKYKNYLNNLVNKLDLRDKVDFLNYVTQERLVSLYQNATALIYPSKIEGFGIPVLEAMACGIPVILSDIPVFHDNFTDIPIYVELGNRKSLEKAINSLENRSLIDNKRQQGVEKAKEYSEKRLCKYLFTAIDEVWPGIIV